MTPEGKKEVASEVSEEDKKREGETVKSVA